MEQARRAQSHLFKRAFAAVAATAVVGLVTALFLETELRVGLLLGLACATISSTAVFILLSRAFGGELKALFNAIVFGMSIRMVLLAAGMLAAKALGASLIAFALAFFLPFLLHQIAELTLVLKRTRAVPPSRPPAAPPAAFPEEKP